MSKLDGRVELPNGMIGVLNINSLAIIETVTNESAFTVLNRIESENPPRITDLRNLFYAVLKPEQPNITLNEALEMCMQYPEALAQIIQVSQPEGNESHEGKTQAVKRNRKVK